MPTISGTTYGLRSRINSINPYAVTYTYLKYCNNYIIGYGMNGLQILKRDCLYGGVRDVAVAIKTKQGSSTDLNKVIRGWGQAYKDLGNQIFGELYKGSADLGGILKGKVIEVENNLNKIIRGWVPAQKDLGGYLKQAFAGQDDLSAYLKQAYAGYIDLPNRLKGWFIEAHKDLGGYTKSVIAGTEDLNKYITPMHIKDLGQNIGLIPAQNLQIIIQHNDRVVNLFGNLRAKYYNDIIGIIRCKYIYDLPTLLIPIEPVDLSALISPILHVNLGAFVDGWYGPTKNLALYVNAVPYKNLTVSLIGWGGYNIPINLRALIASYQEVDLSSSIGTIPAQNLSATLIAKGQSENLTLYITPKVVNFRSVINVSLLEHKDLNAMVNYACFYSNWVSLGAYLYCFSKKDIILRITGTLQSASSTYKNLGALINVYDYYTEDSVIIDYPVVPASDPYTLVNVNFNVAGSYYRTVRTIPIYYYGLWTKNLSASITSIPHSRDLSMFITPEFDYNYTELPSWINPRTREVVIDIRRQSIETKRFIELMFETFAEDQFHYFYVNAEQKVYRVDRDRHWTIKAIGYTKTEGENIERIYVREKTIFNLSHYSNIDEAIRSIIDRAASYREVNLSVQLVCTPPLHYDLQARLNVLRTRSWQKNLHLYAHGLDTRDFALACRAGYESVNDIASTIPKIWQRSYYRGDLTWNENDKGTGITLSNDNKTATSTLTSSYRNVRAILSDNSTVVPGGGGFSSGKYYWEVTVTDTIGNFVGLSTQGSNINYVPGTQVGSWSFTSSPSHGPRLLYNSSYTSWGEVFVSDDTIGVALDVDNGMMWFSVNGVWLEDGDPADGENPAFDNMLEFVDPVATPFLPTNTIHRPGAVAIIDFAGERKLSVGETHQYDAGKGLLYKSPAGFNVTIPSSGFSSPDSLYAGIKGWNGGIYNMRCTVGWYKSIVDFTVYIKQSYEQYRNLYCDVEGMDYVPPEPGNVIFNFVDDGYVVPTASGIELEFGVDELTWDWYEYELPVYNKIRVTRSSIEILRKET